MGYSVPEHARALAALGPTVHHRRSFAPVAAAYGELHRIIVDSANLPRDLTGNLTDGPTDDLRDDLRDDLLAP
jgi:ribonuclease HII